MFVLSCVVFEASVLSHATATESTQVAKTAAKNKLKILFRIDFILALPPNEQNVGAKFHKMKSAPPKATHYNFASPTVATQFLNDNLRLNWKKDKTRIA